MESKAGNQWVPMAKIAGPMLGWLAVSYMISFMLIGVPWFREALEIPSYYGQPVGMIVAATVALCASIAVTAWAFTTPSVERLKGHPPAGMITCKSCGTDLYAGTPVCPYCWAPTGEKPLTQQPTYYSPSQYQYYPYQYNWRR